ncbi:MAG TPA: hypothetical protein VGR73_20610 [Bryobacteraceae bacterium]|nr:hypothetical protein [Bryobacteraceae bacterium]
MEHFTRDDLIGVAIGTLLFAVLLLPPGYLFGWLFDLLDFRRRNWPEQLATSVVLSVSMVPILDYFLWTQFSVYAVWAFYAASGIFFVLFSFRACKATVPRWTIAAAAVWLLVVWFSGVDLQFGDRLYPSVLSYDFTLRTAVISGLARNGLPARNPLFFPGHAQPLRYHYFWLIPCALVELLGGKSVNARQALAASDAWCGWALMATIALYSRFFHPAGERGLEKRVKWGVAMLAVAGLDILPNLGYDIQYGFLKQGPVYATLEWWNNQVTAFPDSMLWVAHHVVGAIACFAGFLLLWRGSRVPGTHPLKTGLCAGLCFASAVGLSVYVTFTFAVFLTIWGMLVLVRGSGRERVAWLAAGIVAVMAALPYLRATGRAGGAGGRFLMTTVRAFTPFELVLPVFGWTWNQIAVANLLVLPLNYFLETGVWFALAIVWWKRAWRRRGHVGEAELAALSMFAVSVLVGTFLRSGVITNNDLGWRSLLIGQMILVVWSIAPLRAWWRLRSGSSAGLRRWRRRMSVLVALGLASTAYEILDLRFYLPLTALRVVPQPAWFSYDPEPGRRAFDAREVFEKVAQSLPQDTILQSNPAGTGIFYGLYAMRQTAGVDLVCGSTFGGNTEDCPRMRAQLIPLFNEPAATRAADVDRICDAWGINVLIAEDDDPIFADRAAWPWRRPTVAERERVRAVQCGGLHRPRGVASGAAGPAKP